MEKNNNYTRSKIIIVSLIFLSLGLFLLFTYALYQQTLPSWMASILQELASILIISGTLTVVSEYFIKTDYLSAINDVEKRLRFSLLTSHNLNRLGDFGIVDCYPNAGQYNFSEFIKDANTLIVCVNDGRSWLSANIHPLREHMMKPNSQTIFILLNPTGNYAPILADKIGLTTDYQAEKCKDTCNQLTNLYNKLHKSTSGSITIYWIDLPILHTTYFSEKLAIIGEFNTARTKSPMPLLFLANLNNENTFYSFIKEDLQSLINDPQTICVFSAKRGKIKVDFNNGCDHSS